jgi:uroporphyrinogen-III synthase
MQLHEAQIDLIAFASKSQISRLFNVAKKSNLEIELNVGLAQTKIAAIGPVVRDELVRFGCEVHVMPNTNFFMKPLVTAAEQLYST